MQSMRWGNVAWVLQRPKGTWLNSQSCLLLVLNAVLCLSTSWMGTCQYPHLISRVENQPAQWRVSNRSSMHGTGYMSLTVVAFNCLKFTLKRNLRYFSHTLTTGNDQGLLEGLIMLLSSICCTCWLALTTKSGSADGKGTTQMAPASQWCVWAHGFVRYHHLPDWICPDIVQATVSIAIVAMETNALVLTRPRTWRHHYLFSLQIPPPQWLPLCLPDVLHEASRVLNSDYARLSMLKAHWPR